MTTDREHSARIVALFAALTHSWERGDVREAARADAELRDLGVAVRMPPWHSLPRFGSPVACAPQSRRAIARQTQAPRGKK